MVYTVVKDRKKVSAQPHAATKKDYKVVRAYGSLSYEGKLGEMMVD